MISRNQHLVSVVSGHQTQANNNKAKQLFKLYGFFSLKVQQYVSDRNPDKYQQK